MAKKLTLQEKLSKRKYKLPNSFIWRALNKLVIKPFLYPKYNPHLTVIDDINKCNGPAFLIYNHQSRIDYVYACTLCYPRRLNFMVGYNEFFRSHLAFISRLMYFIPKKNFNIDIDSMRAVQQIINKNGVVCFSPEGMSSITGHNQPVVSGTGKYLKHYKIPVYCMKLNGAYLTNNKICLDERKGRVDGKLYLLFSKEDLEKLSAEEIEERVNEELWTDEYEWNKKEHVLFESHERICTHLHDLAYHCFKCGHEFEMIGENDEIRCTNCGNGAKQDDYYEFHPFDESCIIPESPSKWVDEERKLVIEEIRKDPDYEFKVKVKIGDLPKYKYLKNMETSRVCGSGLLTINHKGLHYNGTKDGEPFSFSLNFRDLPTLGMVTDVSFCSVYVNGEYYDIFPEIPCVGKLLLLVEEMHRLHFNKWKNFPWMQYMY